MLQKNTGEGKVEGTQWTWVDNYWVWVMGTWELNNLPIYYIHS